MDKYIGAIKAILILAAALLLFAAGVKMGADHERVKNQAEKLALAEQHKQDMQIIKAQQDKDKEDIRKGYQYEISKLRASAASAGRLRINAKVCVSDSESAKRGDADTTGTRLLPEPYSSDLRALMLEADSIVASCRALQELTKRNGMD